MTQRGRDNALMRPWMLACDWSIATPERQIVGGKRRSMNQSDIRRRLCVKMCAADCRQRQDSRFVFTLTTCRGIEDHKISINS